MSSEIHFHILLPQTQMAEEPFCVTAKLPVPKAKINLLVIKPHQLAKEFATPVHLLLD